jgi:hypothetical protein
LNGPSGSLVVGFMNDSVQDRIVRFNPLNTGLHEVRRGDLALIDQGRKPQCVVVGVCLKTHGSSSSSAFDLSSDRRAARARAIKDTSRDFKGAARKPMHINGRKWRRPTRVEFPTTEQT